MNTKGDLSIKVATIKTQMQHYRSLPEYLLDGVGASLSVLVRPRVKRKPFLPEDTLHTNQNGLPSYWFSGLIIAGITLLIGRLVSLILNETWTDRDWVISTWVACVGALALIANKINIRTFLDTFHEFLLEKILVLADLEDFELWLDKNFKIFWPLVGGLIGGPILALILISNLILIDSRMPSIGTMVVIVLACIQSIWVAYYLFPFYISLPSQLARYRFDLYTTDPSSSEVVGRLSRLMTFIMYVTLAFIVQLTLGLNRLEVFNLSTAFIFSLLVWAPTIVLYVAGQYHISNVITRAKWNTLNVIQTKIEMLNATALDKENGAPDKTLLEAIEKLMDSHDRIKATPNSALNFRAGLNFMNSLLLPILAFLFANLEGVIQSIENLLRK